MSARKLSTIEASNASAWIGWSSTGIDSNFHTFTPLLYESLCLGCSMTRCLNTFCRSSSTKSLGVFTKPTSWGMKIASRSLKHSMGRWRQSRALRCQRKCTASGSTWELRHKRSDSCSASVHQLYTCRLEPVLSLSSPIAWSRSCKRIDSRSSRSGCHWAMRPLEWLAAYVLVDCYKIFLLKMY